jgi:hypothetical protein
MSRVRWTIAIAVVLGAVLVPVGGAGGAPTYMSDSFQSAPIPVGSGWIATVIASHYSGGTYSSASATIDFFNHARSIGFIKSGTMGITGNGDQTETVKIDFGTLGKFDMSFVPTGAQHAICPGHNGGFSRKGTMHGTLHFRDGSFKLNASSFSGTLSSYASAGSTNPCSTVHTTTRFDSLAISGTNASNNTSRNFTVTEYLRQRHHTAFLNANYNKPLTVGLFADATISMPSSSSTLHVASNLSSATLLTMGRTIHFTATGHGKHSAFGTIRGTLRMRFPLFGSQSVVQNGDHASLFTN